MDQSELKKIIEYGLYAPSADNGQPWKVRLTDRGFDLFLTIPREHTEHYLGLMGIGAFIKNIEIAALNFGYAPAVEFFSGAGPESPAAKISFTARPPVSSNLFQAIPLRRTNRKPYQDYQLSAAETAALSATSAEGIEIKLTSDTGKIKKLGQAASLHQYLVMTNSILHKYLFSHILWSDVKPAPDGYGMDIKTFEMNPAQRFIFKRCRNWFFLQLLNLVGFSGVVQKENAEVNSHSSGIGTLITPAPLTAYNFINAGKAMQELWLKLTSLGLSMQPLVGVPYLSQQPDLYHSSPELSDSQQQAVGAAYDVIKNEFGLSGQQRAVMMFRYGKAGEPSGRSQRKSLTEVLI